MLNELETTYWTIVNKSINIIEEDLGMFLERLMMTAIFAKKITCTDDDVKVYEAFLSHNYPTFINNFKKWE
jgi:hypothetical protein